MNFEKIDLNTNAIDDLTWRRVRDAFKRINFQPFDQYDLGSWLFRDELIRAKIRDHAEVFGRSYEEVEKSHNYNVVTARRMLSGIYMRNANDQTRLFVSNCNYITARLIAKLTIDEYIQIDEAQGFTNVVWNLTMKGHSLRMQKALKRISRTRADELLNKVISRIEEFNNTIGPNHSIMELWVYGSYLSDMETLGDLDLVVKLERRKNVQCGDENWLDCEARRMIELGLQLPPETYFYNTEREAYKYLQCSPYISLTRDTTWLERLEETGQQHKLIWK